MTAGGGRGRGAGTNQHVQRALGWTGEVAQTHRTEIASCAMCGGELRFTLGDYGQTLELCTSRSCPNRVPHPPRPNPSDLKKPFVPKKRVKRT